MFILEIALTVAAQGRVVQAGLLAVGSASKVVSYVAVLTKRAEGSRACASSALGSSRLGRCATVS